MQFVNLACAIALGLTKMLEWAAVTAVVCWTGLGWLAALLLWGTAGGGAALAVWLAFIIAFICLYLHGPVESRVDRIDGWIEARAHAWKTR